MAYATLDDLMAGWRDLTPSEQERATTLLDRASAMLSALVEVDETDEQQTELLKAVCCSMVQRAMTTSDMYGVTQTSHMAGAYSESFSFANPTGDLYLTKAEKQLLGITGGRAGFKSIGGYDA